MSASLCFCVAPVKRGNCSLKRALNESYLFRLYFFILRGILHRKFYRPTGSCVDLVRDRRSQHFKNTSLTKPRQMSTTRSYVVSHVQLVEFYGVLCFEHSTRSGNTGCSNTHRSIGTIQLTKLLSFYDRW
jgi:hypothetical protein